MECLGKVCICRVMAEFVAVALHLRTIVNCHGARHTKVCSLALHLRPPGKPCQALRLTTGALELIHLACDVTKGIPTSTICRP